MDIRLCVKNFAKVRWLKVRWNRIMLWKEESSILTMYQFFLKLFHPILLFIPILFTHLLSNLIARAWLDFKNSMLSRLLLQLIFFYSTQRGYILTKNSPMRIFAKLSGIHTFFELATRIHKFRWINICNLIF